MTGETHPADKAYDETLDEFAGEPVDMVIVRLVAKEMRKRWKAHAGEE